MISNSQVAPADECSERGMLALFETRFSFRDDLLVELFS